MIKNKHYCDIYEPVISLSGVGSSTEAKLAKLGIERVYDLALHFPFRYLDFSKILKIGELTVGETVTVTGTIKKISKRILPGRRSILEVFIFDGTGYLAGIWFNQSFLERNFQEGNTIAMSGRVEFRLGKLQMSNPFFEDENDAGTKRILPVYYLTSNLYQKTVRKLIRTVLDNFDFPEVLPSGVMNKHSLMERSQALDQIHFPDSIGLAKEARKRFKFEELFLLQSALIYQKNKIRQAKSLPFKEREILTNKAREILGYELTAGQERACDEIKKDLLKSEPMNRLLQGEVGSGKTSVALLAMLLTVENGYQSALMAPTEVLALQHYLKIKQITDKLSVETALLTGSLPEKEKEQVREKLREGNIDIIIGTHALIQEDTAFNDLGLAVIDEQHRFGVEQRSDLKNKPVNTLVMTATPIPRTLALTCYSDLDISTIKELPGGRKLCEKISTLIVKDDKRQKAYEKIRQEVASGRQAYIICPLIEESDKLEAKAVMTEAGYLKNEVFSGLSVGILHGALPGKEKAEILNAFQSGAINILISTTVVEVGIDVGNASVMLIENAERFGLSQLHQLRGRIGRGGHPSFCIAFAKLETDEGKQRMEAFKEFTNGFDLAEADLKIRGEGEITGLRQSGYGDLKLVRLSSDIDLIKTVKDSSAAYLKNNRLDNDIKREISYRFPNVGTALNS